MLGISKVIGRMKEATEDGSLISSVLMGGLIIGILVLAIYISGWAATYLTHMLFDAPYYTNVWTRLLIGLALWIITPGE